MNNFDIVKSRESIRNQELKQKEYVDAAEKVSKIN